MEKEMIQISGYDLEVYSLNTAIVGSGAAGLNAADCLYAMGQTDIAVITEGMNMGTSRNTGSDKQTYYKLSLEGRTPDSVYHMAETLFNGGSMHGDIALVEAALSAKCFYKLVDIGVPFPHNRFGEYVSYKTDHDTGKRATSAGPLTSRYMTEKLETNVRSKGIKVFDRYQVIGILTSTTNYGEKASVGLVTLNLNQLDEKNMGITLFNCTNVIYATGGPAGMYLKSVYPKSQTGASGIAFEAGVAGVNLTESQYGIASTQFRWNLSGSYQQVIPRYISTLPDGSDEREFLQDYFEPPASMLNAVFLKGYQWPFDPRKIQGYGSSLIDLLVYQETQHKGRMVYLDFTKNPSYGSHNGMLDFGLLNDEARTYLENCGATFGTPIERLRKINEPAVLLYERNGIDLSKDYLQIDVCAQHNNGGLVGNIWWESNVKHFFPVGEVCGTFGVYRPGGSALNSTQVGSYRAAQYISKHYTNAPMKINDFLTATASQIKEKIQLAQAVNSRRSSTGNHQASVDKRQLTADKHRASVDSHRATPNDVFQIREKIQSNMTKNGAIFRSLENCRQGIAFCKTQLTKLVENTVIQSSGQIPDFFINRDILITQLVYLSAIQDYLHQGGPSRGSYLVHDQKGELPLEGFADAFRFRVSEGALQDRVCEVFLNTTDGYHCNTEWKKTRPIPSEDNWFEKVWNDYMKDQIIL